MIRAISILATLAAVAMAQPSYNRVNIVPNQAGTTTGLITYRELKTNGVNYLAFRAPTALAANVTWILPNADAVGCFSSDGAGNVSIVACSGAGSTPPFVDTTAIVKGSVDATKELRFEVDGFTTATTNTLTVQDASYTIAGTNITNTFSATQITNDLSPSTAGFWNVGTLSDPYSTMVATTYYTRLVGLSCNYNSSTATALAGGTFAVQDSSCATQARMNSTGFDTVGASGSYKIQGTNVITSARNLQNIASVSTDLIPTVSNVYSLGANTGTGYYAFAYVTNASFEIVNPKNSTSDIGATGAGNGFRAIYGDAINARSTFRLGTSTTSGWCLVSDASGFGTWQTCPGGSSGVTSINGMTNAAQTITIGTSGLTPNVASSLGTTTVNIPQASLIADGTVTTGTQTFGGAKTFSGAVQMNSTLNVSGGTTVQALTVGGNAGFSGTITFSSNMTPLFDSLGSIGTSGLRYGDFYGYRGNYSSTLQAAGLTTLTGGLNVTGTTTLTGTIQFDVDNTRNIGSSLIKANDVYMNRSRATSYYYNGTIGATGTITAGTCVMTFTAGGLTGTSGFC